MLLPYTITLLLGSLFSSINPAGGYPSRVVTLTDALQGQSGSGSRSFQYPPPKPPHQWPPESQGYRLGGDYKNLPETTYGKNGQIHQWRPDEEGHRLGGGYSSPSSAHAQGAPTQGAPTQGVPSYGQQGSWGMGPWMQAAQTVWEPMLQQFVPAAINGATAAWHYAQCHPGTAAAVAAIPLAYHAYNNVPWGPWANAAWNYLPWAAPTEGAQMNPVAEENMYMAAETDPFENFQAEEDMAYANNSPDFVQQYYSQVEDPIDHSAAIQQPSHADADPGFEEQSQVEDPIGHSTVTQQPADAVPSPDFEEQSQVEAPIGQSTITQQPADAVPSGRPTLQSPKDTQASAFSGSPREVDDGYASEGEDFYEEDHFYEADKDDEGIEEDDFNYIPKYHVKACPRPHGHVPRPVVLDGSNVALSGENKIYDGQRLADVATSLEEQGFEVLVVLPERRKQVIQGIKVDKDVANSEVLRQWIEKRSSRATDSKKPKSILWSRKDDIDILEYASKNDGVVISKDRYRNWQDLIKRGKSNFSDPPKVAKVINTRVLNFAFKGHQLVFRTKHNKGMDPETVQQVLYREKH